MKRILFILIASVAALTLCAQSKKTQQNPFSVPGHRYATEYWGLPDQYLEHQAWYMLDLADKAFNANPPSTDVSLEREMAFLMLDAVAHEQDPVHNPAVLDYLARRTKLVADDLEKPLKGKALRIYKIYNCGLIFRTRDVTVAVDLNGRNGMLIPDDIMTRIVDKIDILFYTHNHGDHVDSHVAAMALKREIPVYATDEIFKQDSKVRHIHPDNLWAFEVTLPSTKLQVHVLPGHQDAVKNNIWVITLPDGKVVCATGDQWLSNGKDLVWIKEAVTKIPKIDVLAMDCWIHDFDQHLAAFAPRLLVSQHENEIGGHGIDHREAFWMTMYKNDNIYRISVPYVLMGWGEWYDYK
ncbi:MAG: MBL fold metallo-hydrolase [Bacteroidales bacterium]|nr:MBL fold metallo-hydrolase [Bacteroidales bacterium]